MTASTTAPLGFVAVVSQPGSKVKVGVTADIGTQTFGALTGQPTDGTDPGKITVTATGDDGETVTLTVDYEFSSAVSDLLSTARRVADFRDHNLDQRRTDI